MFYQAEGGSKTKQKPVETKMRIFYNQKKKKKKKKKELRQTHMVILLVAPPTWSKRG